MALAASAAQWVTGGPRRGETLAGEVLALERIQNVLCEINMGATAIGTGLNAPAGYAEKCTAHLARITGFPIHLAPDLVEATQDTQAFVLYSSCMKSLAIKLSKVCNDLRLLSSGPRCGLREINLPPKQPGSSIMPGKVNPSIAEMVNQVCYQVIGCDATVAAASEAGELGRQVRGARRGPCVCESGDAPVRDALFTTFKGNERSADGAGSVEVVRHGQVVD